MPAFERPRFAFSRDLFLRLLGLVYGIAFLSLAPQLPGLVGSEGLLPAAAYLERVHEVQGAEAYYRLPTLLWLWPGDALLLGLCWAGIALSAGAVAGLAPIATFAALWLCYLSLTVAGQGFLSFQWDVLLLETGLLAVLYAPAVGRVRLWAGAEPGAAARWLVWGLAFKLTFLSGITKLLSGDETWWGLTALRYHYETQPIPTWLGWYAHQAPAWLATLSTGVMFAIELAAPFVILFPPRFRRVRAAGVALLCLLQALIALTGNYGFFNLLTVVLYLALLDDATIARVVPGLGARDPGPSPSTRTTPPRPRWRRAGLAAAAVTMALLSTYTFVREIRRPDPMPEWSAELFGWVAPFRSVNGYGLFRSMTVERPEIAVEGSADGITWTEVPFRWKAGDPQRAPGFVQPHMPRLDWQMWFAALGPRAEAHWLFPLAQHLLEASPAVLGLLDDANPFADEPPRFIRLVLYDYRFTTLDEGSDGAWWRRELIAYLTEPIARDDLR
ncbi:MAG: lipase maturation factor family protein [Acidobacteria bacterium]|nr:lipase maturation factor family protein [Acidobacteriota bacterium]